MEPHHLQSFSRVYRREPQKKTHTHTHVNTTRIQYDIHRAQKLQHNVGVLGGGLETFLRSSRSVAKQKYRNQIYVILYQTYLYGGTHCKNHTTQLYNTPVQHEYRGKSGKEKLASTEVER